MLEITRRALLRTGLVASAASLVPDSALANTFFPAESGLVPRKVPAENFLREHILFDFGWKFFMGNGCDSLRDLDFGKDQSDYHGGFAKTGGFGFATENFDDSQWRSVNLPHDWAVELPFVDDETLQPHGYKPLGRKYPETSVGWYRRSFEIPVSDMGRRVFLEFDGVVRDTLVFVNGCFIGRNDNAYVPFGFDVTDFINYGAKNFVVVRVDASFGDGWFYEGAGIYRHVWLTKTDSLHFGNFESYVRAEVKPKATILSLGTVIKNQGEQAENPHINWKILDPDGRIVATASSPAQLIAPGESATFTASAMLHSPEFWSPDTPHLYSAFVSVETSAKIRDAERVSFGVRTIHFDPGKGFFLNGKSLKIKGTCNHQDHAGVGVAMPDALQWYRLSVLREMGSNAVRTSHNMPTPEWVEACDRMGMMMMCETRTMSSSQEAMAQLEAMILRYRNSPSIILWSMGNEEWIIQGKPQGGRIVASMVERSHQLDPTRLCTAAVNGSFGTGISLALDVEGINYSLGVIDEYHRGHPKQPLVGSETASTVSTRGIYITDTLRNWVSAYDLNHPKWGERAEEWWRFCAVRDYLAGGFAWTGFDYRGEPTPYGWPSISSQFGIVDTCGFPKDNFFYYKAWWGQESVLHLFPHWNWQQRIGERISVWVHSNLDEVEIFLNGRSQGIQKVRPLTHLEWKVKYEPGVIEAHGLRDGKVVLTDKRETTGAPASIRLTANRREINADGQDIAILRVEALDKAGRLVPTAGDLILFSISGDGALLGVGNGNPNCQESDKEPKRSLFSGVAQMIVQSTKNPGAIYVEAHAETGSQISSAQLVINTRMVAPHPREFLD